MVLDMSGRIHMQFSPAHIPEGNPRPSRYYTCSFCGQDLLDLASAMPEIFQAEFPGIPFGWQHIRQLFIILENMLMFEMKDLLFECNGISSKIEIGIEQCMEHYLRKWIVPVVLLPFRFRTMFDTKL